MEHPYSHSPHEWRAYEDGREAGAKQERDIIVAYLVLAAKEAKELAGTAVSVEDQVTCRSAQVALTTVANYIRSEQYRA